MDQATVKATFWAAVSAWEEHDFTAYRTHRILLLNMKANARVGRVAFQLHNLLVSYVCFTDKVIPFAAYAMAIACRAFSGLNVDVFADPEQVSVPFQGPRPTPTPLLALEGLFTTLSQRLDQLAQVRTDLPDDYLARSKASFTDALLTELERQHYHSPAFDRLITLRDAWDTGQLDVPTVKEQHV